MKNDGRPLWSPDGKTIIFDTDRSEPAEIYGMNADGSNPTPITHNPGAVNTWAAWLPAAGTP